MSTINPDDQFLVQRGTDSHRTPASTLMSTINATTEPYDYLLIQRGQDSYKVTAKDVKDQLGGGSSGLETVTLAPLTGTPPTEITAVTNLASIPEGATASYKWYQYDADSGSAGATLLQTNVTAEVSNTYTTTSPSQQKWIGCTVTYLGTSVPETARSYMNEAAAPIADMHGLRFERRRDTNLIRYTENTTSSPKSHNYTVSFWVKYTDIPTYTVTCGVDAKWISTPWFGQQNGSWNIYTQSGGHASSSEGPDANRWYHVCVNVTGGAANMYVDNVHVLGPVNSCETSNTGFAVGWNGTQSDLDAYGHCGYLSDFYYVDGRSLPATTFGKNFLLGWGPLDHTAVEANIGVPPLSPYDTRANMAQKWSDGWAGGATGAQWNTADYDGTKAFDGNINQDSSLRAAMPKASVEGGSPVIWNGSIPTNDEKVLLYAWCQAATSETQYIKVNDVALTMTATGGGTFTLNTVDITSILEGDPITKLEIGRSIASDGAMAIAGISIGGRLLVDGPADNSQNWSSNLNPIVAGQTISGVPADGFDGNAAGSGYRVNGGVVLTFTTPYAVNNGVYATAYSSTVGGGTVTYNKGLADEVSVNYSAGLSDGAVIGNTQALNGKTISTIHFENNQGTAQSSGFSSLVINDQVLVDGGAQWDTSQVWSSGTDPSAWGDLVPVKNLFDGNLSTYSYAKVLGDYQTVSWDAITANSSIRVYGRGTDDSWRVIVDDNPVSVEFSGNDPSYDSWRTLNTTFPCQVTGIQSNGPGAVYAIEVDGKILVDAGSFGSNGFYLPFDPAATGENYSQHLSNASNPEYAFNGISDTAGDPAISPAGQTWLWQPVGLNDMTSLKIWAGTGGSQSNGNIILNGADTGISASGGLAERDLTAYITANNITTLTRLEINNTTGEPVSLLAVKYNGSILVDHNNIGVDASGQGNNFHDHNFAVGNTSEVWSKSSNVSGSAFNDSYPVTKMFDGSLDDSNGAVSTGSSTVSFQNVTINNTLRIYGGANDASIVVGVGGITPYGITTTTSYKWYDVALTPGTPCSLDSIQLSDGSVRIMAVEVDGDILVNANIQDTVLDTPMADYAVLTAAAGGSSGLNDGNLTRVPSQAGAETSWLSVNNDFDGTNNVYLELYIPAKGSGRDLLVGFCSDETERLKYGATTTFVTGGADGTTVSGVDWEIADATTLVGFLYRKSLIDLYEDSSKTYTKNLTGDQYFGIDRATGTASGAIRVNFGQQLFASPLVTDNGDGTVTVSTPNNEPYANRPNMTEKWSEGMAASSYGDDISHAFDGSDFYVRTTNQVNGNQFTAKTFTVESSFELRVKDHNSADWPVEVQIDGVNYQNDPGPTGTYTGLLSFPVPAGTYNNFSIWTHDKDDAATVSSVFVQGVVIDGRTLIDGPADNSQNWVDGLAAETADGTPLTVSDSDKAFNGSTTGAKAYATAGQGNKIIWSNTTGLSASTWRVFIYIGSSNTITNKVQADSGTIYNGWDTKEDWTSGLYAWVPIPDAPSVPTTITMISEQSGGSSVAPYLAAVEADGVILVDSGAQWNTSQQWSDGLTISAGGWYNNPGRVQNAFDGDTSTYVENGDTSPGEQITFTPETPIDFAESIAVFCSRNTGSGPSVKLNGTQIFNDVASNDNSWYTYEGSGTINNMEFLNTGSGGYIALAAIKVDGKILVNSSLAGGPIVCRKLYRDWEEQQSALYELTQLRLAQDQVRISALEQVIAQQAVPLQLGVTYPQWTIVSAGGNLYEAMVDDADVSPGDFIARLQSGDEPDWQDLGISV